MLLTGFTDEAGSNVQTQIKATQTLGWKYLSARTIGSGNIHDIGEQEFEEVVNKLSDNGIRVAEFGTLIGNWAKSITDDWDITLAEINRCIPRMQRLGVRFARVMSYAQRPWGEEQYEQERFRRLREIVSRLKDAGLEALHENCMNWGGFSASHTLRLLEEVPGLRLVFDTGNPVFQRDRSKPHPYPWQNAWEFYQQVKHAIAHVHIKDGIVPDGSDDPEYTFAGEGDAHVSTILADLKRDGYDGFVAIEPHMGSVFHSPDKGMEAQRAFAVYVEYGRRFEALLQKL